MTSSEGARPQDKVLILKRVPVFASCSEEQLHLIADRTRLVEYKKGEFIYRQGEQADAFYVVSSGRLRVFSVDGGQEQTLTVLHNGDTFGEISLLTGETHSATVQAINDTLILRLDQKDFEDVINRIPSLVLYLSRLLSKRLRTRDRGGEFAEATIIAIHGAAKGVGRSSFAVALAAMLKRETGRPVAVVDFSQDESGWLSGVRTSGGARPTLTTASEEALESALMEHPLGFGVLSAGELLTESGGESSVAPLLSALTNRFHYVLIDLPVDVNPAVVKALIQADLIYLLTDLRREHLIRTSALLRQLHSTVTPLEQRMKVVLNLRGHQASDVNLEEIAQQIGQPIAFTLPHLEQLSEQLTVDEFSRVLENRGLPYAATVRHVARELGGLLVGLALGSGAALGLAHIGILKVIEREKIPIDIVAGSSIGALVAGLWAAGRSADELEQIALRFKDPWSVRRLFVLDFGIPLFSVMLGLIAGVGVGYLAGFWTGLLFGFMVSVALGLVLGPLVGGPIQGSQLMAQLESDFAGKTFKDTWLPLKVVASNPIAREEVVFDTGSIAAAVRASVSIPGIFKPVTYQGKMVLDGGVVNPIPVSVLKRAGAHHVIAVNVFPTTEELTANRLVLQRRRAERDSQLASRSLPIRLLYRVRQELIRSFSPLVFDVIVRSMQSMEYRIAEISCREADLVLRPAVPGSHWLEFFNPEKFIRRGEEVALQYLPELKRITHFHDIDKTGHPQ
jgi:NTE family protein